MHHRSTRKPFHSRLSGSADSVAVASLSLSLARFPSSRPSSRRGRGRRPLSHHCFPRLRLPAPPSSGPPGPGTRRRGNGAPRKTITHSAARNTLKSERKARAEPSRPSPDLLLLAGWRIVCEFFFLPHPYLFASPPRWAVWAGRARPGAWRRRG